jgi:hypothetical protein
VKPPLSPNSADIRAQTIGFSSATLAQLDPLRTTGHLQFTEEALATLTEAGFEILSNADTEQYQKKREKFRVPTGSFFFVSSC